MTDMKTKDMTEQIKKQTYFSDPRHEIEIGEMQTDPLVRKAFLEGEGNTGTESNTTSWD